jgi:hypothetical protein
MLTLNTIINVGIDSHRQEEFRRFIKHTKEKFDSRHGSNFLKWYERHERYGGDPYKRAAGLYVRILAAPQVFSDGNHREGALIADDYMIMRGQMPFVLSGKCGRVFQSCNGSEI